MGFKFIFGNRNQQFYDNYIIIIVLFDFGEMFGIQDILHDQKINVKMRTDLLNSTRILQSMNLNPINAVRF